MLYATVYATVVFFITEQPPKAETYFKTVIIYILVTVVADGFGIFLGTLVNPIVSGNFNDLKRQNF
jgi:Na+/H+-dicarboxylate symporter